MMTSFLIDIFHYIIALIILAVFIWIIIYIHNYFSKNNKPINNIYDLNDLLNQNKS